MFEENVLSKYKLKVKTLVFSVKYKKTDGLVYEYKISFLKDYSDSRIIEEMVAIRNQSNFLEWLLP